MYDTLGNKICNLTCKTQPNNKEVTDYILKHLKYLECHTDLECADC